MLTLLEKFPRFSLDVCTRTMFESINYESDRSDFLNGISLFFASVRYQNNDEGGHYHEASGNARTKVRGRYGARTPPSGKIDETVYSAGPRG